MCLLKKWWRQLLHYAWPCDHRRALDHHYFVGDENVGSHVAAGVFANAFTCLEDCYVSRVLLICKYVSKHMWAFVGVCVSECMSAYVPQPLNCCLGVQPSWKIFDCRVSLRRDLHAKTMLSVLRRHARTIAKLPSPK